MRPVTELNTKIKLELSDSRTGKILQEVESHNFISKQVKTMLKHITKFDMLRSGYSPMSHTIATPPTYITTNFTAKYPAICDLFGNLYLTDSAMAEDPENEVYIPGALLGFANLQAYSGSSMKRGFINLGASIFENDRLVYVFDFPPRCANGMIRSVGFGMVNADVEDWGNNVPVANNTFVALRSVTHRGIAFANDWIAHTFEYVSVSQSRIVETDLLRHEVINIRDFPVAESGQYVQGLAWDGEHYYTANNTTRKLHKYTYTGSLVATITEGTGIIPVGISVDGTYVYVLRDTSLIRRYNKINLAFVNEINIADYNLSGLVHRIIGVTDGGNVVVSNATMTEILVLNPTNFSLVQRMTSPTVGATCYSGDVKGGIVFGQVSTASTSIYARPYRNLHTRSLLSTPIEKTEFNDLRITYEFLLS